MLLYLLYSVQVSLWWCEDGTRWCWRWLQPWRLMNLLHWPVRMHIASVGVSKFCFLFSLAFCGLLLLLLPTLQPASHQVDLPQPRPQIRPTQVPAVPARAEETDLALGLNGSLVGYGGSTETEAIRNDQTGEDSKHSQGGGALLGGKVGIGLSGSKSHDPLELKDIFIAVKTTRKYHKSRLELLIQTWVSQAKEQVSRPEVVVYVLIIL